MMILNKAALSSLAQVPITDETCDKLIAAGVSEASLRSLSEMAGQSLLALRADLASEDQGYPRCFRLAFDPRDKFCEGCTFAPTCWQGDLKYLHALTAGKVPAPLGVPTIVLEERMNAAQHKPIVPPPPKRKGAPVKDPKIAQRLEQLGYDQRQILRMTPETRDTILAKSIKSDYVSINPHGEMKIIKTKMPPAPPAVLSGRKAAPPPPSKRAMKVAPPPPSKRK